MAQQKATCEESFGYLTTLHTPEHGYFGGYLLVTASGRPLEFHCTSPVRPSRAQEILYGPTLAPYLLGEEISGTLLQAARRPPRVILVDQPALLAVRQRASVPVLLVRATANGESCASSCSAAQEPLEPVVEFERAGHSLQLAVGYESDRDPACAAIEILAQQVELAEPFGRIHEAIREAQRLGDRSTEAYIHAA